MKSTIIILLLALIIWTPSALSFQLKNIYEFELGGKGSYYRYTGFGDFNNDGQLDMIAPTVRASKSVNIFYGDPVHKFVPSNYELRELDDSDKIYDLTVGDFNNDGNADLVVFGSRDESDIPFDRDFVSTMYVYLGDGAGNFEHRFTEQLEDRILINESQLIEDFDKDGLSDLIISQQGIDSTKSGWERDLVRVNMYRNTGGGKFTLQHRFSAPKGSFYKVPILLDHDRDGLLDVAITVGVLQDDKVVPQMHCYLSSEAYGRSVSLGIDTGGANHRLHHSFDFDGNDRIDLWRFSFGTPTVDQDDSLTIYRQNDQGRFEEMLRYALNATWVFNVDFDNDGDQDFVLTNRESHSIELLENLDNQELKAPVQIGRYHNVVRFDIMDLNQDGLQDLVASSTGSPNAVVLLNQRASGIVEGNVFLDTDNNCVYDKASVNLGRQLVEILPGPHYTISDSHGRFRVALIEGSYEFRLPDRKCWTAECEEGGKSEVVEILSRESYSIELPLIAESDCSELDISIAGGWMRPGRASSYAIHFNNSGSIPYNGEIVLELDERLELFDAQPTPDNVFGKTIFWKMDRLPLDGKGQIAVTVKLARNANPGSDVCSVVKSQSSEEGVELFKSSDELCTEVTGSYDPNDIRVWPRGEGEEGRITRDVSTLSYMVRFQNTGNDTTFTVVVRDTLPEELNVRRLRFGAASHEYSVDLLKNNILEFTFDDILLPDSTTDLLGSQGYVKFRIDLHEDLPVGTQVRNRVGIYFDFNDVVMTNTALTTISSGVTSVDFNWNVESLSLSPNPTTEMLTVSGLASGTETLAIVDVHGRELKRLLVDGHSNISVNCQDLAPGSYFLQTRGVGLPRMARFVVVR